MGKLLCLKEIKPLGRVGLSIPFVITILQLTVLLRESEDDVKEIYSGASLSSRFSMCGGIKGSQVGHREFSFPIE
jgi:hypothetical protein